MTEHRIRVTGVETCTTTRDLVVETDDPEQFLNQLKEGEVGQDHPSVLSVTEKECTPEKFDIKVGEILE